MPVFSDIHIIYNPVSTGPSESNARELKLALEEAGYKAELHITPTEYAGHAEKLAKEIADNAKGSGTLIVSSSGDGGYNEVVNGIMSSKNAATVACAVLPSGNANDHSRTLQQRPLIEAILAGGMTKIDLLRVVISHDDTSTTRYAHSYVGLGITPVVARELNRYTLHWLREKWIVLKTLLTFRPFAIIVDGKKILVDSLIFSNINQMAKVVTLSKENDPVSGTFKVSRISHIKKRYFIFKILKAVLWRLKSAKEVTKYELITREPMPIQLDGEVVELQKDTTIQVFAAHAALNTVL